MAAQDIYNPVPGVAPTTSMPNDYISARATSASFGAAPAEALEGLGKTVGQVGSEAADAGNKWMQLHNDMVANEGTNQYANTVADADTQFRQLKGQNMLAAWGPFRQNLQDQLNKQADAMPSPVAKSQFLKDARSFYDRTVYNLGNVVADTAYKSTIESYDGKLKSIANMATINANDPKALQDAIEQTTETALLLNHTMGVTDKDAANASVQSNVGALVSDVILAQASRGATTQDRLDSIQTAQQTLANMEKAVIPGSPGVPILDAKHIDQLQQELTNRSFYMQGRQNKQTVDGAVLDSVQSMHQTFQVDSLTGASSGNTPYVENKSDGISTTQQYVDRFKSKLTGKPFSVDNYYNAFVNTEGSHTTSAKGAVGPEQIEPGTFAGEAKLMGHPDWDINNDTQRAEVAKHLIGRLWEEYHDPEKVAVAYFSGEGNVAKDSGKSSIPYGTPQTQNFGEWLDNNQGRVIEEKTEEFKKNNPELASDPTILTDFRHKLYTETSREMTEFKRQNKGDEDSVYGFLSGNNPTKQIIANPLMLESDPNIAPIWERFKQNNPKKAYDIETHLITANAHGIAMGLGTDYWKNFSEAAQGHITDSLSLSGNVGWDKDAPLTNTGLSSLNPVIQRNNDPIGQATNQAIYKFLNSQRPFVTGTGTRPGVYTPELDLKWNQYLQVTLPRIEAGLKEGKTAAQMFDDPKGKDYVGGALGMFKPDTDKLMKHMINTTMMKPGDVVNAVSGGPKPAGNQPQTSTAPVINNRDDLAKAFHSSQIDESKIYEYFEQHPDQIPPLIPGGK